MTKATAAALAGIALLLVAQVAWVSPTNFSGYDEWLFISLTTRGLISYPYENRPVVYLWHLPPSLLWPHSINAYYVAHHTYILFIGWLTFALVRRIAPWSLPLAFVAGALAATWAPSDHARLISVAITGYSGHTAATLAAVLLFLEAFRRHSVPWLGAAMAVGLLSARGTEAAIPILGAAPLLLYFVPSARFPKMWRWIAAWECLVLVAGLLALWPVVFPPPTGSRQANLGLDLRPGPVTKRLVDQFAFHVLPLVTTPPLEMRHVAVLLSAVLCWLCFRVVAASAPAAGGPEHRRPLAMLMALGAFLAALGYSLFSLTGSLAIPVRTEFFSGPGIAIALAAGIFLLLTVLPARWRAVAGSLLMAWVLAVSAARTLAMQRDWNAWGLYPSQSALLRQATALAPDLKPNTLVVLHDPAIFKASYTFRHAVTYLYQGRAVGIAWGASDFLYPTRFAPEGVVTDPHPAIREAWRSPPAFHRYDEVIVLYVGDDGRLAIADRWPDGLPPLPAGATYAPRDRIVSPSGPIPERGILGR